MFSSQHVWPLPSQRGNTNHWNCKIRRRTWKPSPSVFGIHRPNRFFAVRIRSPNFGVSRSGASKSGAIAVRWRSAPWCLGGKNDARDPGSPGRVRGRSRSPRSPPSPVCMFGRRPESAKSSVGEGTRAHAEVLLEGRKNVGRRDFSCPETQAKVWNAP